MLHNYARMAKGLHCQQQRHEAAGAWAMINDGENGHESTRPTPSTTQSATGSLRREAWPSRHDRYVHVSPAYLSTS
jgi:hypothetical protein